MIYRNTFSELAIDICRFCTVNENKPLAFVSRSLIGAERKYSEIDADTLEFSFPEKIKIQTYPW